jgi:hypothetical protein
VITLSDWPDVTESDVAQGGPIERRVRADIADMTGLTGVKRSTAEICYNLARELDSGESASAAALAKQLVTLLADLERGTQGREVSSVDAIVAGVADELAPRRRTVASPGA